MSNEFVMVPRDLANRLKVACESVGWTLSNELCEILAKPAEQHQGEPVAGIDAEPFFGLLEALRGHIGYAIQFPVNCDSFKDGISKVWATIESLEKCIAIAAQQTHTDPGEVERLRDREAAAIRASVHIAKERDTLRARLAERDALLREVINGKTRTQFDGDLMHRILMALSASAEPSAPVEIDELG